MERDKLREYASEILSILNTKSYNGFDVSEDIEKMLNDTQSYIGVSNYKKDCEEVSNKNCKVSVVNDGTINVMIEQYNKYGSSCGLNFASAKNPGGGFENGARAQEESICYSSLLYGSLINERKTYELSRKNLNDGLYSTWAIYSPNVVIVRDQSMKLVEPKVKCSFVTSPAPNKGVYKGKTYDVRKALEERCRLVLDICIEHKEKNIVLGAFGCGVFKNSPLEVATTWYNLLTKENYLKYFEHIDFGVLASNRDKTNFDTFRRVLGNNLMKYNSK